MWTCHASHAQLATPTLTATIDLSHPELGMHELVVQGWGNPVAISTARLFGLRFSPESRPILSRLADSWVRGSDLVAVYAETSELALRPEIYWRALMPSAVAAGGIELIASVQTQLLDAPATMTSRSELDGGELLWLPDPSHTASVRTLGPAESSAAFDRTQGEGLIVCRVNGAPFSYVEMVYPSDMSAARLDWQSGRASLEWRLFPESIEKGVIRRARLRGVFVSRDRDLEEAAREFHQFATSSLPLTT